jgi:dTDP-glucose 4,6-dehydratase
LVRAYHRTYGLAVTISNCSNNYGRFHFPEKLIPLLIVNMLQGRRLPIYGDGLNVRDWLHVTDHCRGIDAVIRRGTAGESYNIGGYCEYSNRELAMVLCSIADQVFVERPVLRTRYPDCPASRGQPVSSLISFVKDRPGHDRRYATDCRKIEAQLGFRAGISLQQGLRDTFLWYTDNESWWRPIVDGKQHLGGGNR